MVAACSLPLIMRVMISVQAQANAAMPEQALDKGQIGALIGLFDDGIEIANRLMGVNQENETELAQV